MTRKVPGRNQRRDKIGLGSAVAMQLILIQRLKPSEEWRNEK
jgi:hypothetical protein